MFKKKVITVAVGLCFMSGMAMAATQTSGSIAGSAMSGAIIKIVGKGTGIVREVTVDNAGKYQVSQLPAGSYTVTIKTADGKVETTEVSVSSGEGTVTNFGSAERLVITGRNATTLNTKSSESSQILSEAKIDRIPVIRDVTAVALLAPGATEGDSRMGVTTTRAGNTPSLGGASSAENVYYINGFNVTNIVNGVAYNQVPFEAIAEQQVKTGGYSAEYGRSLGGVINITSKRGTNEWKGGVSAVYTPGSLRGTSVYTMRGLDNKWALVKRPGEADDLKYNAWAGGPLIQDKLYGFAIVQGADYKSTSYGATQQVELKNSTPQYLVKMDWNVNKDNLFELTAFSDKSKDKLQTWNSTSQYGTGKKTDLGVSEYTSGGENVVGKWTSWITDSLTISGMFGSGKYDRSNFVAGSDCPVVQDQRTTPTKTLGCSTAVSIDNPKGFDQRDAWRLDAEWTLGAHTIRGGLDNEKYTSLQGTVYPGGESYVITPLSAGGTINNGYVNNTGAGFDYVTVRHFENGGKFTIDNKAWYVEDNYQFLPNWVATIGLRNESFTNYNANNKPFIDVANTWSPRLGIAWDVNGDSRAKVFANAGRYYIPVYANTNLRLAGRELDYEDYYKLNALGTDAKAIPVLGEKLGSRNSLSSGASPNPLSVVDPNLKPMYQDEFILGGQLALTDRWSIGLKGTYRKLKSSMDDICSYQKPYAWAVANGYSHTANNPDDEYGSGSQADVIGQAVEHCFLYNPGTDLTANIDIDGTGKLTKLVIPNSVIKMPEGTRVYKALEFSFERAWDNKWSLQGSYVWSSLYGNQEGYVNSDIGQDDAGLTVAFDFPGLMEGATGYLPNDRRHTFKLFGSYQVTSEWRFGANLLSQSGRPRSCLGYYAGTDNPEAKSYGSYSHYCNGVLSPRGAVGRLPWKNELGVQATYTPAWQKGLTLQMDVMNVFNQRAVLGVLERGESALGTPRANYEQPILDSLQKPRTFRFMAQYEF